MSLIESSDQDATKAGIPDARDLIAAEQISGDCPGTTLVIDLHRQIGPTGLNHGLALEGQ